MGSQRTHRRKRDTAMRNPSLISTLKALAIAGAALLSAGVSGCSSDEYYCDANGCFYCDNVGCRAVNAPTRATCLGDYQCPANRVCTSLGCTATCASDTECEQGWVCRGAMGTTRGYCVAPREPTPTPNPGACRTNTDCQGGATCVNGACVRPTCDSSTTTCGCSADSQCATGNFCVGGRCQPPSDTCRFNSQCGAGRVCVNQQCRPACTDGSCPTGQACQDGACVDRPAGQCTRDAECMATQRCVNATCLNRCTGNAECGTGNYCTDAGVCAVDTRRQPFCTNNSQCAAGSECLDGVCRRPCADSNECLRTDVTYRNCARISYLSTSRLFCQTNNEANTNCGRQADCSMGQACVDGVCRGS
jgi:hypothetical protein